MGDRPQARHAYYQVKGDLDRYLTVRNSDKNRQRQYASWDEVRSTINDEQSTFTLHVSHLDTVPLSIPVTGDGYQVLNSVDGWRRASTSTVVRDPATDSYVSAPSRFEGDLVISFKWTLGNWIRAWMYWAWRTLLRALAWLLLLAVAAAVAWAVWQLPWAWGVQTISSAWAARQPEATAPLPPQVSPQSNANRRPPSGVASSDASGGGAFVAGRPPRVGNG